MSILSTLISDAVQRESEQLERDRLLREAQEQRRNNEKLQAAVIEQAEQKRLREAHIQTEMRRIRRVIFDVKTRFASALRHKLAGWPSADLMHADAYAEALLNERITQLPEVPARVAEAVNMTFAIGVARVVDQLPRNVFAGQKQAWFPDLLEQARAELDHSKRVKQPEPEVDETETVSSPVAPRGARVVYTSRSILTEEELRQPVERSTATAQEQSTPLPAAITPKTRGGKRKKAHA